MGASLGALPTNDAARDLTLVSVVASRALPCREQLIGLTDVTRSHFEKLVDEFEKGLETALKEYDGGWVNRCGVWCGGGGQ